MVNDLDRPDTWIESVEARIVAQAHATHWVILDGSETRYGTELFDTSAQAWARIDQMGTRGAYMRAAQAQANGTTHSVTGEHTMGRIMNDA